MSTRLERKAMAIMVKMINDVINDVPSTTLGSDSYSKLAEVRRGLELMNGDAAKRAGDI